MLEQVDGQVIATMVNAEELYGSSGETPFYLAIEDNQVILGTGGDCGSNQVMAGTMSLTGVLSELRYTNVTTYTIGLLKWSLQYSFICVK